MEHYGAEFLKVSNYGLHIADSEGYISWYLVVIEWCLVVIEWYLVVIEWYLVVIENVMGISRDR